MSCSEIEQLERLAAGDLDDAEQHEIERHLVECEACRRQLEDVRRNVRMERRFDGKPDLGPTKSAARLQVL